MLKRMAVLLFHISFMMFHISFMMNEDIWQKKFRVYKFLCVFLAVQLFPLTVLQPCVAPCWVLAFSSPDADGELR